MDPVFIKGMLAFVGMVVVFVGTIWLLLSMILGVRLGYFVMGACLSGVMILISSIWFVTALGPKGADGFLGSLGEETGWQPVAVGPNLSSASTKFGQFGFSDYPGGDWKKPSSTGHLADLKGDQSTGSELQNVAPVLESLVSDAVNDIPGIRRRVRPSVKGEVSVDPENFSIVDVRMKEETVAGKDSVVAVGKAVPTAELNSGALNNAAEGEVTKLLVKAGDTVSPGMPLMTVKTDTGQFDLTSDKDGKLVEFGFRVGDNIKPNVPFATIDVSGQPEAAPPAEVAAARVRGSIRVPAFIYLAGSVLLFIVHLRGVSRTERALKAAQPQSA